MKLFCEICGESFYTDETLQMKEHKRKHLIEFTDAVIWHIDRMRTNGCAEEVILGFSQSVKYKIKCEFLTESERFPRKFCAVKM